MDVARFALGVTALTLPRSVLHAAGSVDATWPRRVTRLLGARYLAQSVTGLVVRDRRILLGDTVVEIAHALTAVGFATYFSRHRTPALASGALAVGFAVADLAAFSASERAGRTP
ncbi:hypothetical protein [Nocardioides sp. MH1]|uniref:hypothetical protein n=1 Tax=Nocardioides sp. MH1 TaxID=3242490 RepID=UPI0035220CAB